MLTAAAVLACALDLLGRSHALAPVRFVPEPPRAVSRNAEAFIAGDPPAIYLITSTQAFREAQEGRFGPNSRDGCQKIASIIVHEEWHLKHGSDERGAYQAQLTTLALLGARSPLITTVRQSMLAVMETQKRTNRPALLVAKRQE